MNNYMVINTLNLYKYYICSPETKSFIKEVKYYINYLNNLFE